MKSFHAVFASDGEWFIARCLDYPITTQGRTLVAAKKNLQEAVELYLETWGDPFALRGRKKIPEGCGLDESEGSELARDSGRICREQARSHRVME